MDIDVNYYRELIEELGVPEGIQDRLNSYLADLEAEVVIFPIVDTNELTARYYSSHVNNTSPSEKHVVDEYLRKIAAEFPKDYADDVDFVADTVRSIIEEMDEEVLPAFKKYIDNFVQEQAQVKLRERIKELKRELSVLEAQEAKIKRADFKKPVEIWEDDDEGEEEQDEQEKKYDKLI